MIDGRPQSGGASTDSAGSSCSVRTRTDASAAWTFALVPDRRRGRAASSPRDQALDALRPHAEVRVRLVRTWAVASDAAGRSSYVDGELPDDVPTLVRAARSGVGRGPRRLPLHGGAALGLRPAPGDRPTGHCTSWARPQLDNRSAARDCRCTLRSLGTATTPSGTRASGARRRHAPRATSSGSSAPIDGLATLDAALRGRRRARATELAAPAADQAGLREVVRLREPDPVRRRARRVADGVTDAVAVHRRRSAGPRAAGRGRSATVARAPPGHRVARVPRSARSSTGWRRT